MVLPFWYRLTWVVPEKGPLNGCVYHPVYNACAPASSRRFRAHLQMIHARAVNAPPLRTRGGGDSRRRYSPRPRRQNLINIERKQPRRRATGIALARSLATAANTPGGRRRRSYSCRTDIFLAPPTVPMQYRLSSAAGVALLFPSHRTRMHRLVGGGGVRWVRTHPTPK